MIIRFSGFAILAMMISASSYGLPKDKFVFYHARQQEKSFPADPSGKCSLKRFVLQEFDTGTINQNHPGKTRSTATTAVIETTDPSCILNYATVQFVRGCEYTIDYFPGTKTYKRYFGETRDSRGVEGVPFVHRKWEIDSSDLDPLYQSSANSSTVADRMTDQYRLNGKKELLLENDLESLKKDYEISNDPQFRNFLQKSDLSNLNQTFTTDLPSSGNYDPRIEYDRFGTQINVTNTSLEFKTCVYAIENIPTDRDPKGFDVPEAEGGPIVCFDWSHKNTFNFKTKEFEKNKFEGIDPFCSTPLDAESN